MEWSRDPWLFKGLVERQAYDDSDFDVEDLVGAVHEQLLKLGPDSTTKKAVHIFGHVGHQKSIAQYSSAALGKLERFQIQQRTLTKMLLENLLASLSALGNSATSSAITGISAALATLWRVWRVNWMIIFLLLLSLAANALFVSRETSTWWAERKAERFMARIGVGPNKRVSRSIYLKDLEEALTPLHPRVLGEVNSQCHDQFQWIVNATDLETPLHMAGAIFSETSTRSTARRLRRTRQHLGAYRYDLSIAMRVVNRIERAMLEAEWENWLLDENLRCQQVSLMLQDLSAGAAPGPLHEADLPLLLRSHDLGNGNGRYDEILRWQQEYCGSCVTEQELLRKGHSGLAFA